MDSTKDLYQELADSCKELEDSSRKMADSYKSLYAMAADFLSSWERFKAQQAAATSSASTTTTTPPPITPVQGPAISEESPTNIELVVDRPL